MKTSPCAHCDQPFAVPNTGRPKKFCSVRCRVANHRRAKKAKGGLYVPDELAVADRWVRHKRKRPLTVEGRSASVTDPETWASLEDARESQVGDGLGFVTGEGIGCVDLDGVIDAKGVLHPSARWLLAQLPETWVEVSPSGRGLHVWGLLPEGRGRVLKFEGISVEVYSRGRYLTVTGVPFVQRDGFGECVAAPARLADLAGSLDFLL